MRWHLFCHVIDNLGDAGVCWRLAHSLAREAQDHITLWIDQAHALDLIAPMQTRPHNITLKPWQPGVNDSARLENNDEPDVVIETFGCHTTIEYKARINNIYPQALLINLEYLSAEPYAQRSHGLPSPIMNGPAKGMTQWFFYPGFTPGTGGVMCADAPTLERHSKPEAFIFSYESAALAVVCEALLLDGIKPSIAEGRAADYARAYFTQTLLAQCRIQALVPQTKFDALLASNTINIVRGEDSFVRAQLAARPFVWHIYPQDDAAHWPKLEAFFTLYAEGLNAQAKQALWSVWKGFNDGTLSAAQWQAMMKHLPAIEQQAKLWREKLIANGDLTSKLRAFVASKLALVDPTQAKQA